MLTYCFKNQVTHTHNIIVIRKVNNILLLELQTYCYYRKQIYLVRNANIQFYYYINGTDLVSQRLFSPIYTCSLYTVEFQINY